MATNTNNEIFSLAFAVVDDGTHFYGKYKGKLLIAMATDANNEIFLLAFAVVDDGTHLSACLCPNTH